VARGRYIVGIDEVGRGPLAGPVVVAAVAMPAGFRPRAPELPLRDSKKLTVIQKRAWFDYIRQEPRIAFALARVYPHRIDRFNVSRAANRAAARALSKLMLRSRLRKCRVYLDGGLFLEKALAVPTKTLVRGDEKINAIKLASIIAKVARDRYMLKLHRRYPVYGFDEHKGYGTRKHKRALRKYGPSPMHRLTFCANFLRIKP